jgi:hypothetical protein
LRQVIKALSGTQPSSYPAAYVFPLAESGLANEVYGGHRQRVNASFAVEIMVKSAASAASGGPAQEALEDIRDAVGTALRGWTPDTNTAPFDFKAGKLIGFDAGLAIWRDEYVTDFTV